MNILLDTHTLLWFLTDDAALSPLAKQTIEDLHNQVFISPASYWEIAIKISLGKYQLNESLDSFIENQLEKNQFLILPILPTHTNAIIDLPLHHRDPFDRLMIAQALVEKMAFISADHVIKLYPIKTIS